MKFRLLIPFIICLTVLSCKKENPEESSPTNSNNNNNTSTGDSLKLIYPDADAVLFCKTVHLHDSLVPLGNFEFKLGGFYAYFGLQGNFPPYADCGILKLDTTILNKSTTENYYIYSTTKAYTQVVSLPEVNWNSNGNSSTGFNAFNENIGEMPRVDSIVSVRHIASNSSYQIEYSGSCADCDSVEYEIGQGNFYLKKVVLGNSNTCPFSSSEMGLLNTGKSEIIIKQRRTISRVVNGKKFYFLKVALFTDDDIYIQ